MGGRECRGGRAMWRHVRVVCVAARGACAAARLREGRACQVGEGGLQAVARLVRLRQRQRAARAWSGSVSAARRSATRGCRAVRREQRPLRCGCGRLPTWRVAPKSRRWQREAARRRGGRRDSSLQGLSRYRGRLAAHTQPLPRCAPLRRTRCRLAAPGKRTRLPRVPILTTAVDVADAEAMPAAETTRRGEAVERRANTDAAPRVACTGSAARSGTHAGAGARTPRRPEGAAAAAAGSTARVVFIANAAMAPKRSHRTRQ